MKSSGYEMCREAIERARLEVPIECEPFTIAFNPYLLNEVRDFFGYDLYREVMTDMGVFE